MTAPPAGQRDDGVLELLPARPARSSRRVSAAAVTAVGLAGWVLVLALSDRHDWRLPTGLALVWLVGWGALGARLPPGRLGWTVAPALHLAEYVGYARLAALARPTSLGPAYLLVAVLAAHHYDLVYRTAATQRLAGRIAGGWAVRLALAYATVATGVARPAFIAAAAALGVGFTVEAARHWKNGTTDRSSPVPSDRETS
jgi:hypothetical protein